MPLNSRASFTLSTPSMAGRIAGLLQSSLQTAVTTICYFPMISWWLAYITVNIYWKNIHAHNMLFLRLTTLRALFYLTPTWYDVVGRLVSLPFWGSPGLGGIRTAGLYPLAGLLDYEDTRLKTSSRVRMGLSLAWKASLESWYEDTFLCNRLCTTLVPPVSI